MIIFVIDFLARLAAFLVAFLVRLTMLPVYIVFEFIAITIAERVNPIRALAVVFSTLPIYFTDHA